MNVITHLERVPAGGQGVHDHDRDADPATRLGRHKTAAPGLPATLIQRPRLFRRLDELFTEHNVVWICATAGSGKTVAAQSYAARSGLATVWLNLDPADRSYSRLAECLVAAFGRLGHPIGHLQPSLPPGGPNPIEAATAVALALDSRQQLLVLDNAEVLAENGQALDFLAEFFSWIPSQTRVIVISRDACAVLPWARLRLTGHAAVLSDRDLALDADETTELLGALRSSHLDAEATLASTNGWVAGVVFFAMGGINQPIDDQAAFFHYMYTEIFSRLPKAERDFLLATSILASVTPAGAEALLGPRSLRMWRSVAIRNLPATVTSDRHLIYHPCFREFLLARFQSEQPRRYRALQKTNAKLLLDAGLAEEAMDVLVDSGQLDEAQHAAQHALPAVLQRGDWAVAGQWLDRLGPRRLARQPYLQAANIRLLVATGRVREAQVAIDELEAGGQLAGLCADDPGLVPYLSWAFQASPKRALELLDRYPGDHRSEGFRYHLRVLTLDEPVPPPPPAQWLEVERHVAWGLFVQGRLNELDSYLREHDAWSPHAFFRTPHPLLGLIWRGQINKARQIFDAVPEHVRASTHRHSWMHLEAWLLWAEGRCDEALTLAVNAVQTARSTHGGWEPCLQIVVARNLLTLGESERALALLAEYSGSLRSSGHRAYWEWAEALRGLALLRVARPGEAREVLDRCVRSMDGSARLVMRPFAGMYLAEAEHRLGNPAQAQATAEAALAASLDMGSVFPIQQALRDCPGLLSQRSRLVTRHSQWRNVLLLPTVAAVPARAGSAPRRALRVETIGARWGIVDDNGTAVTRRLKAVEFAALMVLHPDGLDGESFRSLLFPHQEKGRTGNHFRQILHILRLSGISIDNGPLVRLGTDLVLTSSDVDLEVGVHEGLSLVGRPRLERLLDALALASGDYLIDSDLPWVQRRRTRLDLLVEQGLTEAADAALQIAEPELAAELAERLIERNPYSEDGYRCLMHAHALTSGVAGAVQDYRRMQRSLAELGLAPDSRSVAALESIRRGASPAADVAPDRVGPSAQARRLGAGGRRGAAGYR